MNHNRAPIIDQPANVTASEDSNSSKLGDSGQDSSLPSSSENATESERGSSGSGGSDTGNGSGGSETGGASGGSEPGDNDQEMNGDDQDSDKRREVRKLRRVMANRRSARESRERRKKLLVDLQRSVDRLTTENSDLAQSNLTMRQELVQLLQQAGLSTGLPSSMLSNGLLQSIIGGQQAEAAAAPSPVAATASVYGEPPAKRSRHEREG